ncbi:hypothetical protein FOCC_FOCC017223, partial [Frankliniella occidentalis]
MTVLIIFQFYMIVTALMESKSGEAYTALYEELRSLGLELRKVALDMEDSQRQAIAHVYREERAALLLFLLICYFHVCKALITYAQSKCGLKVLMETDQDIMVMVKSVMAVPRLPAGDMDRAVKDTIQPELEAAGKYNADTKKFLDHFRGHYVARLGPELSVFGRDNFTTSPLEGTHRAFNQEMKNKHPSFSHFLLTIRNEEKAMFDRTEQDIIPRKRATLMRTLTRKARTKHEEEMAYRGGEEEEQVDDPGSPVMQEGAAEDRQLLPLSPLPPLPGEGEEQVDGTGSPVLQDGAAEDGQLSPLSPLPPLPQDLVVTSPRRSQSLPSPPEVEFTTPEERVLANDSTHIYDVDTDVDEWDYREINEQFLRMRPWEEQEDDNEAEAQEPVGVEVVEAVAFEKRQETSCDDMVQSDHAVVESAPTPVQEQETQPPLALASPDLAVTTTTAEAETQEQSQAAAVVQQKAAASPVTARDAHAQPVEESDDAIIESAPTPVQEQEPPLTLASPDLAVTTAEAETQEQSQAAAVVQQIAAASPVTARDAHAKPV